MRYSVSALTTAVVLLTATAVSAAAAMPGNTPLRRLLKNVAAYVQAHPKDPNGYYTLGRLLFFAASTPTKVRPARFEAKPDKVPTYFPGNADRLPDISGGPPSFQRTPQEQVAFVRDAVRNLTRAIELRDAWGVDKGNEYAPARSPGLFELCLASALEAGASHAKQVGPLPPTAPTPDPNAWREAAIRLYKGIWDTSDRNERNVDSVAYEASENWLRLVKQRGPTTTERVEMARVAIERKRNEPRRPRRDGASPIILSLTPGKRLNDLLDNRRRVTFDLHGDGLKRTHTWLKPDTALLVWDPQRTGKITSGKQLFGSVSWWLFWSNGYQALAALDDNHDGTLTGPELSSLSLWFDRNQNGVSDRGEVVPLSQTPIVSLSVRWTGRVGQSWESKGGATLRDGTRLTTWDWVTR